MICSFNQIWFSMKKFQKTTHSIDNIKTYSSVCLNVCLNFKTVINVKYNKSIGLRTAFVCMRWYFKSICVPHWLSFPFKFLLTSKENRNKKLYDKEEYIERESYNHGNVFQGQWFDKCPLHHSTKLSLKLLFAQFFFFSLTTSIENLLLQGYISFMWIHKLQDDECFC